MSTVTPEAQQVSQRLGSVLEELEQFGSCLDSVVQKVSATEALKEHLGNKT